MRIILFTALIMIVTACNFSSIEHDPDNVFEDQQAYDASDKVVARVLEKDIEGFLDLAHPDARSQAGIHEQMVKFFDLIPGGQEFEISHYYSELRRGEGDYSGVPVYLTGYDVIAADEFAQLFIAVAPLEGECCATTYWKITSTNVRPSKFYDFTFVNKGPKHYVVFALLLLVPTFIIFTVVACWRNPLASKKGLWIAFILIGLWGVNFNWATGDMSHEFFSVSGGRINFNLIQIHFLGAGFTKLGAFQPWIIVVGSPVGALLYWLFPARAKHIPQKAFE